MGLLNCDHIKRLSMITAALKSMQNVHYNVETKLALKITIRTKMRANLHFVQYI